MKTTTIISSAAVVLSTFTNAAPTPSNSIAEAERRNAKAEAAPITMTTTSEKREANEPIVVRTDNVDEDFVKRNTSSTAGEGSTDSEDACVIM